MATFTAKIKATLLGGGILLYITFGVCIGPALGERASLVIDADSGAVLHAKNARLPSYPASLTKLMTVYLLLEAIESKQMMPNEKITVSRMAQSQPPVKLGLKQGWTISPQELLMALIMRSANDAAVVAAEQLAGSETAFARMMTARARSLGMTDTMYSNASGLPDHRQITSARDTAILVQAILANFPEYESLFSRQIFHYRGKTFKSRNNFANSFEGAYGLKTGFTCQAGYNLVAAAERDGRRLIGVVLGERNLHQRRSLMAKILNKGFAQTKFDDKMLTVYKLKGAPNQGKDQKPNRHALAHSCIVKAPAIKVEKKGVSGWGLLIGVRKNNDRALELASEAIHQYPDLLKDGRPLAIPFLRGVLLNYAFVTDLKKEDARAACRRKRSKQEYCIVMNPDVSRLHFDKGKLALERTQAMVQ